MVPSRFDVRRPLLPVVGLPGAMRGTPVLAAEHLELMEEAGVQVLLDSDRTPIPAIEDRENYYGDRHLEYWLSGLADWRKLARWLDRTPAPHRYLDLGGASGRVVRHAARMPRVECWLSDINVNLVDWVERHFADPVHAYQGRPVPLIPAEDGSFSLISAFSVFTHLDAEEVHWLLEMRRVLRPGGLLYLTVNDEAVWDRLKLRDWEWLRLSLARGVDVARFAELVRSPMPEERFVWRYSDAAAYNCNVFLSSAYVRRRWGRFLEVVDYRPADHAYQSVVVLRKP